MLAQRTTSIHQGWVAEWTNQLYNQLPRMQGSRYEACALQATEYYVIGSHALERVTVTEGVPMLGYEPRMEPYRDFLRNTASWVKVMGDTVFTTREGNRTVTFSQVLDSIVTCLSRVEGVLVHAPLVDAGRHLLLYVQEPVFTPGSHRIQYRHWQVMIPTCRIGEFFWTM
jgi:hypothetical protein